MDSAPDQSKPELNLSAETQLLSSYEQFIARIRRAKESGSPLNIVGGGSKQFYGRSIEGEQLDTRGYCGIVEYEAAELVITVRAGTRLVEVERTLAEQGQMLAFEPPHFGAESTIGGVIAAGLSGPRRPYAGAVRDAVLGTTVMDSNGEALNFGGQVMKNVAGYDVSRLMTGAMGTLGLLLAISVRVGPRPQAEHTAVWEMTAATAHKRMVEIAQQPLPITAMSFDGKYFRARIAGHMSAVAEAEVSLAPDSIESDSYWSELRDQTLPFFRSEDPLWRLSVPPASASVDIEGEWLWDWGGACRWLRCSAPAARIRSLASAAGGHATLFRGADNDSPFTPLDRASLRIHQRLKDTFDPDRIFNPGRMYADI